MICWTFSEKVNKGIMKKLGLALCAFMLSIAINAQTWTRETTKEFRKCKDIAITVDFSDVQVMGMSKNAFYFYYKNNNKHVTDKDIDQMLDKFGNRMSVAICNKFKKNMVNPGESRFELVCYVKKITESAGYTVVFFAKDNGVQTKFGTSYTFEGKMLEGDHFEHALLESAKTGIEEIVKYDSPFSFPYYDYEF